MGRRNLSLAFGRILKQHREARDLSQEDLAFKAGVHRTYIGLLERGERNPTIDVGDALARALGTSLSEMVRQAETGTARV